VVVAFVLSAGLCAGGAIALVKTSANDGKPRALPTPSVSPLPSEQPTVAPTTPAPTTSPTPVATATPTVTAVPSPTHTATSSPTPRRTTSPRPSPTGSTVEGLSSSASINYATGGTTADHFVVTAKATDGNGTIYLQSIDWGDDPPATLHERGTACSPPATAPADCRKYPEGHDYAAAGSYIITIEFVSGTETSVLHLTVKVDPAP